MLNLKSLIILFLISFSFQDQNCLITFKYCDYEIKINNCIEHSFDDNNIEKCEECKNGYVVSDDRKSCIEIKNQIDHCIEYYDNGGGIIICRKCENNYAVSEDYKSCVEVTNRIVHCTRYSKSGGDFDCDGCENNYVLYYNSNNYECVKFDHCIQLDDIEDKEHCGWCEEGYVFSNDRKSCKSFANCYLLDAAGTKCSKCYDSYYLNSNGQCEKTLCTKYSNNVCTDCNEGYYLNDKKECQKIPIENCLQLDDSKKKCSECLAGIIPDDEGKCTLPSKLIEGCEEYEKNGDCRTCAYKYKLSSDKKKCEYQCTGGKSIEYCGICKPGYYDDDGICLGYDGSKDSSSNERHKVQYALLSIILLLLI